MKYLMLLSLMCVACGKLEVKPSNKDSAVVPVVQPSEPVTPTPQPAPIVTPTPVVDVVGNDVKALIDDENLYRLSLGQSIITGGLSCSVQQVVSGLWISSSSVGYNALQGVLSGGSSTTYTYTYKGLFNQPDANAGGNNLIPESIRPLYVGNNYVIRCNGFLVVRETGYYGFEMSSDDGSILTIDGTQVINNDGAHGVVKKVGTKLLRRGVRSFNLVYAQTGGGSFAMILKSQGSSIDPLFYAH